MPQAEGGCYRPTQPPPNRPLQMLAPVGHKEWPTESAEQPPHLREQPDPIAPPAGELSRSD